MSRVANQISFHRLGIIDDSETILNFQIKMFNCQRSTMGFPLCLFWGLRSMGNRILYPVTEVALILLSLFGKENPPPGEESPRKCDP